MSLGVGPLKQSFVRALRDISALKAAVGSDGISEGVALEGTEYPFVIYSVGSVYRSRTFGSEGILKATIDVVAVSGNQVEAHNLDQLILDGLEDVELDFTDAVPAADEPSTLLCHRVSDLSSVDVDEAGNKVYRAGGTYQIWLDRL